MPRNQQLEEDARALVKILHQGMLPGCGFVLFLFEFGEDGWLTYIADAEREDVVKVLREWLDKQDRTPGGIMTGGN